MSHDRTLAEAARLLEGSPDLVARFLAGLGPGRRTDLALAILRQRGDPVQGELVARQRAEIALEALRCQRSDEPAMLGGKEVAHLAGFLVRALHDEPKRVDEGRAPSPVIMVLREPDGDDRHVFFSACGRGADCPTCAEAMWPDHEPLHGHGDGCPACHPPGADGPVLSYQGNLGQGVLVRYEPDGSIGPAGDDAVDAIGYAMQQVHRSARRSMRDAFTIRFDPPYGTLDVSP